MAPMSPRAYLALLTRAQPGVRPAPPMAPRAYLAHLTGVRRG